MSLTFGLSAWILALLVVAAAAGAIWLYTRTVPLLDGAMRYVLSALRFLSLGILAFLLVEPLLTRESTVSDPPVVAVLVDDSQSMTISGSAIPGSSSLLAPLEARLGTSDIRSYRFGSDLSDTPIPDSAGFGQGRTDIARALVEVQADLEDENLAGIVLISDGRYNTGRNPLHVADRFPVPIHTVTVGDTTARRDVQVRRILTNEIAYRDVALPLDVGIRHDGFEGQRVTVRVSAAGAVLDQAQIDLPAAAGETAVRLEVTPDTTGLVRYDVSVSRSPDEFTYRNNVASVSVVVLESRRQVLLVAGAPGPDLTALRAALGSDDDVAVDLFVRRPSGGYFQGPLPELADFDLIVMTGYPSAGTELTDIDALSTAIEGGTPVLFALGPATDVRLMRRLGNAIPAQPRVMRTGRTEGVPVPTAAGLRHPSFSFPQDVPPDVWNSLPPLTITDMSWQLAPDAQALATVAIRGVQLDDPSIVVRRRSGARAAALLAYGTWRWHNLPESLAPFDPVWPALVENLVQWLSAPEDDRPVRVRPAAPSFEGGDQVEFFGQVYDESAQPVSGATVDLQITTPDGSTLPFAMRSIGSGRYRAALGTLPEGSYRYAAEASLSDQTLGTDAGTFSVGPLALEFLDTSADLALMRQIALRSGGEALVAGQATGLAESIRSTAGFAPRTRMLQESIRLWQRYPFLLLVLVLLTAEWFLRKRRGLV